MFCLEGIQADRKNKDVSIKIVGLAALSLKCVKLVNSLVIFLWVIQ
jgi:hypothetical protein